MFYLPCACSHAFDWWQIQRQYPVHSYVPARLQKSRQCQSKSLKDVWSWLVLIFFLSSFQLLTLLPYIFRSNICAGLSTEEWLFPFRVQKWWQWWGMLAHCATLSLSMIKEHGQESDTILESDHVCVRNQQRIVPVHSVGLYWIRLASQQTCLPVSCVEAHDLT